METLECIKNRRSIRRFLPKMIEREKLVKILEAGTYAPSSGNVQNWRFVVVNEKDMKSKIANATLQLEIVESAPLVVVVCSKTELVVNDYKDKGNLYAIQNTAAAVENMLLAATDLGLGSLWIGAFSDRAVIKALQISEGVDVHAIVVLGYIGKSAGSVLRNDPANITYFNEWKILREGDIQSAFFSALSKLKRKQ